MIEAVNSAVFNASLLRQSAQQAESAAQSLSAASPADSISKGPVAPYVDRISMDTNFDTAVLELRDNETGDVLKQFPTESTLEARQRAESVRARAETLKQVRTPSQLSSETGDVQGREVSPPVAQSNSLIQASPQQSLGGAGVAQAAIAALSTGSSSGQVSGGSLSVFA